MRVSELLRNRMTELNLNADQIADACGVNRATVYRWLSGEIDNMKRTNIASLAKILKLDPALIVGDINDDESSAITIPSFTTAQEAVRFILIQPLVADFGGYDLNEMTDEEIIDFANEIAGMIRFAAEHHYNKRE